MEVRAYTMKFVAERKREEQKMKKDIEEKIGRVQNSNVDKDMEELERLIHKLNEIETKEEVNAARKAMARYKLEGEKPMSFFCKMNNLYREGGGGILQGIGGKHLQVVRKKMTLRIFYWINFTHKSTFNLG